MNNNKQRLKNQLLRLESRLRRIDHKIVASETRGFPTPFRDESPESIARCRTRRDALVGKVNRAAWAYNHA